MIEYTILELRSLLWIATFLSIGGLGLGCSDSSEHREAAEASPVSVETATVKMAFVPVTVTAVGSAEPFARATPGTRLLGRVVEVGASAGDLVRKGEVLVRIEVSDLEARKGRALSGLQEADAVLKRAEADLGRVRNLYREGAVTKQKLDHEETRFSRAKAAAASAKAALLEVEANLRYSTIASPLEGVVVRKFVQQGDMASPGAPLFTVEQQHPIKVTVEVSERDLAYVRVDSPVVVSIEALRNDTDGGVAIGKVDAVVPSKHPGSRTFQVKVLIPNPQGKIGSGMFARVRFQKGERPGILIPGTSVVRQGQLQGVYVVQDGTARLRWIRTGKDFGEQLEVLSGLEPGEVVVVGHQDRIDGRRVEVRGNG